MSAQSTHTDSNAYVSRPTDTSKPELAVSGQAPTANDLLAAYDPARLHPLAGLGDKLDYLLLDDDKKKRNFLALIQRFLQEGGATTFVMGQVRCI